MMKIKKLYIVGIEITDGLTTAKYRNIIES